MPKPSYLDLYEVVRLPRPPHLKTASYAPYYLAEFPKQAAYSVDGGLGGPVWHLAEEKP